MQVDAKRILKKIKERPGKVKITLYVGETIYEDFKTACGDTVISAVVEELMVSFVASLGKKRAAKSK